MWQSLTNQASIEAAYTRLRQLLDARGEWFCTEQPNGATTYALRPGEWELRVAHNALLLSLWTERGAQVWRIVAWEQLGEHLLFDVTRRMGAERQRLELIPRASARAASAMLVAARRAACQSLAARCAAHLAGAQVERAGLSRGARRGEPGRYARILLRTPACMRIAVTGSIVDLSAHEVDAFLASALLWLARLNATARGPGTIRLWLVMRKETLAATLERVALLREALRRVISVYEASDEQNSLTPLPPSDELPERAPENQTLTLAHVHNLDEIIATSTVRLRRPMQIPVSDAASQIIALAPEAIDVVRARHGETLRYHGLAFARVRRVMNEEHVWFGVNQRQLLNDGNRPQLLKLLSELDEHRRAHANDARHAYYRATPEAWLESLLRRDISKLDPGLILSPLHAQFRTSHRDGTATDAGSSSRPIDLLALRRDGRLVVIELKVFEDAALALQGADYWRRVESQRRCGHLAHARLFGDAIIADEPSLVYLVAPLLRFHRAFQSLAHAITPEIPMYRFDLNEDWRAGVRVMRRGDLT